MPRCKKKYFIDSEIMLIISLRAGENFFSQWYIHYSVVSEKSHGIFISINYVKLEKVDIYILHTIPRTLKYVFAHGEIMNIISLSSNKIFCCDIIYLISLRAVSVHSKTILIIPRSLDKPSKSRYNIYIYINIVIFFLYFRRWLRNPESDQELRSPLLRNIPRVQDIRR